MPPPDKFDLTKGTLTPINTTAPKKFDLSKGTLKPINTVDYSGGPTNKEGQYVMIGPDKKAILVAYSQVEAASKAGYVMDPTSRATYVRDSAADPNLKNLSPIKGLKAVGRNSAGQIIVAPEEQAQDGSALGRLGSSFVSPIVDTVKGFYHTIADKPKDKTEEVLSLNPVALLAKRMLVDSSNAQAAKARSEFEQAKTDHSNAAAHNTRGFVHAVGSGVPMVGPWVADVWEKVATQVGKGDYAGAVGTLAGNAALNEAPKVIGKGASLIAKAPRATLEAVTDTSPREIKNIAEEVQKKNTDASEKATKANTENAQQHLDKTQDALHKTKGDELLTEMDNKESIKKAKDDHAAEVDKVTEHNQRVVAKHKAVSERIQKENEAAEHALELRRSEEAKLQKETTDYYSKEDAVKAKVKSDADAKWTPVHQALDAKTIDGGLIQTPLDKIIEISPDVRRELNQLIPDPEDAAPDSMYAKDRAAVMQSQGYDPKDYWKLPDNMRNKIDKMCSSNGFTPEPIDFDPKVGVAIPFDKVHRAQSIIGRNIRNGRYGYDGPLLGEMTQLQKVLYNAESKIASDNGLSSDLDEARQATREYKEAFGVDRHAPKTLPEIRKQEANPEQFKEENEQKRVDAAKKHDPSLATDYEKVKAHREAVKKLQTEDQLRKSRKQAPPPPTVDDLRDGYRLKRYPNPPEPKVTLPERTAPPDRPPEVKPDIKTITPEDYKARQMEHIKATAKQLRSMGLRRALYATMTALPFSVIEAFKGEGAGKSLAGGVLAGGVVLGGSHMLANLIERPDVAAWISKVTPEKAAEWEKLPPEQKALFTQDMKAIIEEADKKKVPVSPALRLFVTGGVASQKAPAKKTPQELVDDYNKAHPDKQPIVVPQTAAPQTVGNQSSVKPSWSHVFDEKSGRIIPA